MDDANTDCRDALRARRGVLGEEIRHPEWPGAPAHTRGEIIQRVFSHDVSHIAELNETLGVQGLPQVDLWN